MRLSTANRPSCLDERKRHEVKGVLTNVRECDYLIVLITSDILLISYWRNREEDISAKYH
jgi:hypothetical protein